MPSAPATALLALALDAAQLKRTPRTGWQVRGAPLGGTAENVAAHSFGVAFLTMLLLDHEPLADPSHALRLALLHDLAESRIGDLPVTTRRYLPAGAKQQAERAALHEIVAGLPHASHYLALWEEYTAGESAAARLVKDADRLDLLIQAYLYEQAGQANLAEFWEGEIPPYFSATAQAIHGALVEARQALRRGEG